MNTTIKTAMASLGVMALSTPAFAHGPHEVAGGSEGMLAHMLSQPDHIFAITAVVILAVGAFVYAKARGQKQQD